LLLLPYSAVAFGLVLVPCKISSLLASWDSKAILLTGAHSPDDNFAGAGVVCTAKQFIHALFLNN